MEQIGIAPALDLRAWCGKASGAALRSFLAPLYPGVKGALYCALASPGATFQGADASGEPSDERIDALLLFDERPRARRRRRRDDDRRRIDARNRRRGRCARSGRLDREPVEIADVAGR